MSTVRKARDPRWWAKWRASGAVGTPQFRTFQIVQSSQRMMTGNLEAVVSFFKAHSSRPWPGGIRALRRCLIQMNMRDIICLTAWPDKLRSVQLQPEDVQGGRK